MGHETRSYLIAIDPGINGAYAVLDGAGEFIQADELPRFDKTLNATELGKLFEGFIPRLAAIEKVGAMPKQGVTSVFTFGCAYGVCLGVAGGAGVPVALILPNAWKKHFRLIGKPKDAARELAARLYPRAVNSLRLKKHHGRADAILIGRYAFDMDNGRKFT